MPSLAGSSALSPASKARAVSASKSSSPPAHSGLSAKDRMKAKVASALQQAPPNNIGNFTKGAGAHASPPTKPAASFSKSNPTEWPVGAGRGKVTYYERRSCRDNFWPKIIRANVSTTAKGPLHYAPACPDLTVSWLEVYGDTST